MKTMLVWGSALLTMILFQAEVSAQDAGLPHPAMNVQSDEPTAQSAGALRNDAVPNNSTATKAQGQDSGKVADSGWVHTVSQTMDGDVAGRTWVFSATGHAQPARVRVAFVQKGQIVSTATSDEFGRFAAKKVSPGAYAIIATGLEGIGLSWAKVVPYNPRSTEILEIMVVPTVDAQLLGNLITNPDPAVAHPAAPVPSAPAKPFSQPQEK